MEIKLNEVKIEPVLDSVKREKISDEEYFSKKYTNYISNSRLKLINPEQGGSPELYKSGFTGETCTSLIIGSSVHQLLLQKEIFTLGPEINKPSAKLGQVLDLVIEYNKTHSLYDSIVKACKEVQYYANNIDSKRICKIIESGMEYMFYRKQYSNPNMLFLSKRDRDVVVNCIDKLNNNSQVTHLLNPSEDVQSFNEDAFFITFKCSHQNKNCEIKCKMKADNWTIDLENKIIVLNDLKTTGKLIGQFMQNSFVKFHYARQFAFYLYVLLRYCEKEYGYNSEDWRFQCNVIVSETTADNKSAVFNITKDLLDEGRKEFCNLLKRVACCEMYGYSNKHMFI